MQSGFGPPISIPTEKTRDHRKNPGNAGSFPEGDAAIGTGTVGSMDQGDLIRIQIRVSRGIAPDHEPLVEAACFKAFGCDWTIAAGSFITEWVKNRTLDEALQVDSCRVSSELNMPDDKIHCAALAVDALKAAVRDYNSRQNAAQLSVPNQDGE